MIFKKTIDRIVCETISDQIINKQIELTLQYGKHLKTEDYIYRYTLL